MSEKELIPNFGSASLTQDQRTSFDRDGFLTFPQFLIPEDVASLQEQVSRFITQVLPQLPDHHVFYEDRRRPETLKQIQQMGEHDSWFANLISNSRFRHVAEALLGTPVEPRNLQYFNKPPSCSQATPAHQDGFYFMLSPPNAVTMWLALDHVNEENGCVRYVKGSHQAGLRDHTRTQTLGFSQGIADFPTANDRENEVPCHAEPGDLLVHHALTIHRAAENKSHHRTRRALGFIYYSSEAKVDIVAHNAYQQQLSRELKQSGKI